ncbi:unnamed protein product [Prorocentrum cordatum]|uniref:Uncharacterized protein n=1 Tax=Prorocentrum cordatum TaxID=2364126 RepID=A0ABN9WZY6_9DINO|nr:unnamed protein product [Polarella glacialis]
MIICRVPTRGVKGKSPPLANQATAHGRPWAPRSLAAHRQTVRASTGGEEEEEEESGKAGEEEASSELTLQQSARGKAEGSHPGSLFRYYNIRPPGAGNRALQAG